MGNLYLNTVTRSSSKPKLSVSLTWVLIVKSMDLLSDFKISQGEARAFM